MFNQEGNNINYYCQIEKKATLGISSLHSRASLYKTAYKKGGRCVKSQPLSVVSARSLQVPLHNHPELHACSLLLFRRTNYNSIS